MQPLLYFQQLEKRFGHKKVFSKLSAQIYPGHFIFLYGPNGAGKSTLLRTLAGIYKPTQGKVGWQKQEDSKVLYDIMAHESMFYSRLSAIENLSYISALAKANAQEIPHVLKQTGLWKYATKRIETYSRGMLQRLSIAKILLTKPRFLFLDEPFSGLDAEAQSFLKKLLEKKGLPENHWHIEAYLYVDHNWDRGQRFSNAIWYLEQGFLQIKTK